MKDLFNPLSEEELQELENFLMSDITPEECMTIPVLDGFLTCLVVGPETIVPSEWLPIVWGETADDPMVWDSQEQAEKYLGMIYRHLNGLAALFEQYPDDFEALTEWREIDGTEVRILDDWCWGFKQGVRLRSQLWQQLTDEDSCEQGLTVLSIYGTEDGWDLLRDNPELRERHEEFAEMLDPGIVEIYYYWLDRRVEPASEPVRSEKVGRNEPCPCGSGKKYKKCCGGTPTIH